MVASDELQMADNFIADFMGELNQDLNQIEIENGVRIIQNQNTWIQSNECMNIEQFGQNFVPQYSTGNDVYTNSQVLDQSNILNYNNNINMLQNQIIPTTFILDSSLNCEPIQQAYQADLTSTVSIGESQLNNSISFNNLQQPSKLMVSNQTNNNINNNRKIRKNLKELLKNDTVKQNEPLGFAQKNQLFNFDSSTPKDDTNNAKQKSRSINSIINNGSNTSIQKNTLKNLLNKPNLDVKAPIITNQTNFTTTNQFQNQQKNQQVFPLETNIVFNNFFSKFLLFLPMMRLFYFS